MIPLRDTERSRTKPVIVPAIILINAVVFVYELNLGGEVEAFIFHFGLIPREYFALAGWGPAGWVERFGPFLSSMFVHGGFLHVAFNMLFLWIFGDNVEDRMGKPRFVVFYLLCGVAAAYLQLYMHPESKIPMVGASGAIAGVMGGYMVLFPKARVVALVPIFFFLHFVELPAYFFIGFWFLIQIFTGWTSLVSGEAGGVAWWAHVGGFAAGALLVKIFEKRARLASRSQAG